MELTYTGEHGVKVVAKNPDEPMRDYFRNLIREKYQEEVDGFLEEVGVAFRKLKLGESLVLKSRPIVVTMSREKEKSKTPPPNRKE